MLKVRSEGEELEEKSEDERQAFLLLYPLLGIAHVFDRFRLFLSMPKQEERWPLFSLEAIIWVSTLMFHYGYTEEVFVQSPEVNHVWKSFH